MNILHIASIENNPFSGVCVAVPQHIKAQSDFAQVALLNITNVAIDGIANLRYEKPFAIKKLSQPYNRPDIVVFNEAYYVEYLSIAKQLRSENIPYVIIPHGELQRQAQKQKWIKKKVANILLWNRFIQGAKAVQCLSQREADETVFKVNKFIGTNGVTLPQNRKIDFNKEEIRFLYIGRLDVHTKGLDLLLEAVARVKAFLKENNCIIDIYGPDFQGRYAYMQDLIREKNIGEVVKLHCEVTGIQKESLLLDSDIFIQTSRFEGMPLGIVEAMSYGMPCLITKGTTLGGYIDSYDFGWVAETNVDGISEKIIQAVRERGLWLKKGRNARELTKNNFAWNKIANDTVEQYKKVI